MAELEQFLYLANSYNGRACVALIQQVLNHKKIFVFGELLAVPSIQALKDGEFSKSYSTLELFAFGRYADYAYNKDRYLELSEVQEKKLKQLTLVSLAHESQMLSYDILLAELQLESIRSLEDLIIDSIYSGLVLGKLNQREQIFRVKEAMGRDVPVDKISDVIDKLEAWRAKCQQTRAQLENANLMCRSGRETHASEQLQLQISADETKNAILDELNRMSDKKAGKDDKGSSPRSLQRSIFESFGWER